MPGWAQNYLGMLVICWRPIQSFCERPQKAQTSNMIIFLSARFLVIIWQMNQLNLKYLLLESKLLTEIGHRIHCSRYGEQSSESKTRDRNMTLNGWYPKIGNQKIMKMICCDRPRFPNCNLFRLEPEFIRNVLHPKFSLLPNLAKPNRSSSLAESLRAADFGCARDFSSSNIIFWFRS